jgi:hypothetical protein
MKKELALLGEELHGYNVDNIKTDVNILFVWKYSDSTNRKLC